MIMFVIDLHLVLKELYVFLEALLNKYMATGEEAIAKKSAFFSIYNYTKSNS